jgi:hypothetical protein
LTLLVKDANTTVQPLSTQLDAASNLVPVHAPASVVSGIATPVGPAAPLPVINNAGTAAVSGDGTIISATVAQTLFGGAVPVNGFQISNNTAQPLFVSDVGAAGLNVGMQVAAGSIYTTPTGYKPAGPVSIYGGVASGNFAARRW